MDEQTAAHATEAAEDLARATHARLERHNGWTNRETWIVNLWLTNEAQAEASCREIAQEADSDLEAGEQIKERWCEALAESAGPSDGMLCDLISQALARVDWRAIGQAFREA